MIPLGRRPSGGIPVSVRAVLFLFCMSYVMFHLEKGSSAKEIQTPPPNNNETTVLHDASWAHGDAGDSGCHSKRDWEDFRSSELNSWCIVLRTHISAQEASAATHRVLCWLLRHLHFPDDCYVLSCQVMAVFVRSEFNHESNLFIQIHSSCINIWSEFEYYVCFSDSFLLNSQWHFGERRKITVTEIWLGTWKFFS